MLKLRSSAHIRTHRHVRNYRFVTHNTGQSLQTASLVQQAEEEAGLLSREARRQWLIARWRAHQQRAKAIR